MTEGRDGNLKEQVRQHWEGEVCYTRYGESPSRRQYFQEIELARYRLEPYIPAFAGFTASRGRRVLEIGVGAGTDFRQWLAHGARASGLDLTEAAVACTRENLEAHGIFPEPGDLRVADAENLPFPDREFDLVYSYGVLHHSPDPEQAFREVYRVLKPGGEVKVMLYHVPSWTAGMLWLQHGLGKGRPFRSLHDVVFHHLESPGTKAYTRAEARDLLRQAGFVAVRQTLQLGPGDLLLTKPSRKYQGPIYRLIWRLYPRWLVAGLGTRFGLNMLVSGEKPGEGGGESGGRREAG